MKLSNVAPYQPVWVRLVPFVFRMAPFQFRFDSVASPFSLRSCRDLPVLLTLRFRIIKIRRVTDSDQNSLGSREFAKSRSHWSHVWIPYGIMQYGLIRNNNGDLTCWTVSLRNGYVAIRMRVFWAAIRRRKFWTVQKFGLYLSVWDTGISRNPYVTNTEGIRNIRRAYGPYGDITSWVRNAFRIQRYHSVVLPYAFRYHSVSLTFSIRSARYQPSIGVYGAYTETKRRLNALLTPSGPIRNDNGETTGWLRSHYGIKTERTRPYGPYAFRIVNVSIP